MILYWAYPAEGAGHAVRAAAICRWLKSDFLVLRGTDDPTINRALHYFDIPYVVVDNRRDSIEYVKRESPKTLILDDACTSPLARRAQMFIWRLGRPDRCLRNVPVVRLEGPRAIGPLVMLDESEILSKEEAREDLGLPQDAFLRIGVPSTSRPGVVESQNPDYMLTQWPALKWMRAADQIVGCIGANLYSEVQYLGLPATWIRAPRAPDQTVRIHALPEIAPVPNVGKTIAAMIEEIHTKP